MRIFGGIFVLSLLACESSPPTLMEANPTTLRDQSGALFGWDCSEDNRCRLKRFDDAPPLPPCTDPDTPPAYSYAWGRFFEIAGVCVVNKDGVAWVSQGGWGRLVVCESDDDCPQMLNYETPDEYECRAGFCQHADHERHPPDVLPNWQTMFALCTGDQPRYEEKYTPEIVLAVDAACPQDPYLPCDSVPEGCPDPR